MRRTIGIIGCGNMGGVIISSLVASPLSSSTDLVTSDRDGRRRDYIRRRCRIKVLKDNIKLIRASQIIVIAVKPQDINEVLDQIRNNLTAQPAVISIAAGVTTRYIEKRINLRLPVIRVMPNLAVRVGQGMSVLCKGRFTSKGELNLARKIFQTMGKTLIMKEKYLDAVTAISGSGPAYFYYFIQALIEAGCKLGMNSAQVQILVNQTALGAIKLLEESNLSPQALKDLVTSKKGTTEAAIKIFEQEGLTELIKKAVFAANKRAGELSRQ